MLSVARAGKWSPTSKCCLNVRMWPSRTVSLSGRQILTASRSGRVMRPVSRSPGRSASWSLRLSSSSCPRSTALTARRSGTTSRRPSPTSGWRTPSAVRWRAPPAASPRPGQTARRWSSRSVERFLWPTVNPRLFTNQHRRNYTGRNVSFLTRRRRRLHQTATVSLSLLHWELTLARVTAVTSEDGALQPGILFFLFILFIYIYFLWWS